MEENNTKEINLLQLISIFINWLKKIGLGIVNILGNILKLSYRHFFVLVIIIGASVIIGQYLSRKSARIYKAEAMVMIYGSEAQTVRDISRQIENSSSISPLISLATKLSIPDSIAKNIVEIHSFYVIDYMKDSVADMVDFNNNHSLSDTTNIRMKDRIYFQLQTRNLEQVPLVENALLKYFNNNKTLSTQFENKKNELIQQINICNTEMKRLDSLAKVSYFKESEKQLRFDNNRLIVGEQRKQLFYEELLKLQKEKAKTQDKLINFSQPVTIPSGFIVNPLPLNGRVKYGIYSLLIGYAIALIISLLIENYKKIFKYLKS